MDAATQLQFVELAKLTIPVAIAVVGTLGGGYLGHRYAKEQARTAKSIEFVERRIKEFYSPMVGCVKRIRALSALRAEISQAGSAAWQAICESAPQPFLESGELYKPYAAIIDYDNSQLYEEILPAYDRMVTIFTENYWLADDKTQGHYEELCRFVEIWHRFRKRALPREVLDQLQHSEDSLAPLYGLLEKKLVELRAIVAHRQAA